MSSLQSKLVIFTIQNRNLLKGHLQRQVITRQTSTAASKSLPRGTNGRPSR